MVFACFCIDHICCDHPFYSVFFVTRRQTILLQLRSQH